MIETARTQTNEVEPFEFEYVYQCACGELMTEGMWELVRNTGLTSPKCLSSFVAEEGKSEYGCPHCGYGSDGKNIDWE